MGNNRKIKAKATALTLTSIMMLGMLAGCGGNNGNNAAGDAAGNATNKGMRLIQPMRLRILLRSR